VALYINPFGLVWGRSQLVSVFNSWKVTDVLLILIGGVFPQAFINPPRNMGMKVRSHLLNVGEF
jgi:hypothetical protein